MQRSDCDVVLHADTYKVPGAPSPYARVWYIDPRTNKRYVFTSADKRQAMIHARMDIVKRFGIETIRDETGGR